MLSFDVLTVFFLAAVALGFAPGPDNIFVLTQSALYGRIAGIAVTLGLCTGLLVHTSAVAFGVAGIFATSATAFTVLKILGAAYLLFLAWQAIRADAMTLAGKENAQPSLAQLYRRGTIMNVTNQKVAIFFLAFLPQFADPSIGPLVPQLLMLGAIFIVATVLVFGAVALGAGLVGAWLKSTPKAQLVMNRIAALVFVGLAARLLIADR